MSTAVDLTKHCPKCHRDLPRTDYWKNRSTGDGLQNYCKPCLLSLQKPSSEDTIERRRAKEAERAARAQRLAREREQRAALREQNRQAKAERLKTEETARAARILERQRVKEEARPKPVLKPVATPPVESVDIFICDRTDHHGSRCQCGKWRKTKCGFPNQGGICGIPLCADHGHEIREGLKYCDEHYERAMRAMDRARG